MNSLQ
ncbi:hypothetical protein YPPY98_2326, partial [Yersinia pestis PY-98]